MLFFANFGKKPNLFRRSKDNRSVQLTIKNAFLLKQIYNKNTKI